MTRNSPTTMIACFIHDVLNGVFLLWMVSSCYEWFLPAMNHQHGITVHGYLYFLHLECNQRNMFKWVCEGKLKSNWPDTVNITVNVHTGSVSFLLQCIKKKTKHISLQPFSNNLKCNTLHQAIVLFYMIKGVVQC